MGNGLFSRVKGWASQPFNESGDWLDWSLFTVLILTVAFAWSRVLVTVTRDIEKA